MAKRDKKGFWRILIFLLRRGKLYRATRRAISFPFKTLKYFIKKAIGWQGTPLLIPYRSFGNDDIVFFKGRVVENYGIPSPNIKDSRFKNFLSMLKRYKSTGWPDIEVKILFEGKILETTTDEDGFFEIYYYPENTQDGKPIWHQVTYAISVNGQIGNMQSMKNAEVMFPNKRCQFGVISDIDDTFLLSHSTKKLKKIRQIAFRNALTRKPLQSIPEFYRALKKGVSGANDTPFFYVSSSEWNLYELIDDFCEHRQIPKGVFLLKDLEFRLSRFWKAGGGNHQHKVQKIEMVFSMYPELPFILVGDSGQHDAFIYEQVAMKHPKQIKAIYIRDIGNPKKKEEVLVVTKRLKKYGIEMVFVDTIEKLVENALGNRLISSESAQQILEIKEGF